MSSSVTTAVPAGLITDAWCIKDLLDFNDERYECANATTQQRPSDFDTICCAGNIVDLSHDRHDHHTQNYTEIDVANLVCCLDKDTPLQHVPTSTGTDDVCRQGTPTPLASLAATNTDNAALYPRTFENARDAFENYTATQTPECLWVYTAAGIPMASVTVPAADISTMSLTGRYSISTYSPITTSASSMSDSSTEAQETITTTSGTLTLTLPVTHGFNEPTATETAASTTTSSLADPQATPSMLSVLLLALLAVDVLTGT